MRIGSLREWQSLACIPYLGILASLQLIDPSVANIALVKASDALQMHGAVLALGASVSTLAQAASVLVMGFFGDRFGRRRVLAASLLLALVGNLLSMLAGEPGLFLLGRALTGIALGSATPVILSGTYAPLMSAVVFGLSVFMAPGAVTNFSRKNLPPESWGRAIGLFTVMFAIGRLPGWIAQWKEMLENGEKLGGELRDPNSVEPQQPEYVTGVFRSTRPEYAIIVGICTHLGCSPQFVPEVEPQEYDQNWLGGFFCPCHGSKFDMAGRVFSGVPAGANLQVPPHYFVDDNTILVGEDQEGAA